MVAGMYEQGKALNVAGAVRDRRRDRPGRHAPLDLAAVWDCYARQQGVPLRTLLGGERTEIPVGASLGMNPIPQTVASVARHVEQGYQRVKLKIEPGWDVDMLAAVRADFPDIELTVDANSAYTLEMMDLLHQIDQFGCTTSSSRCTGTTCSTTPTWPPCCDRAVPRRVAHLAGSGEGRARPQGVHGRQREGRPRRRAAERCTEIHEMCVARNVPMWCGGMLETGIGRAHNIHLATMPGFVFPGDTASASRTYSRDITEQQLEATNGIMPVPAGARHRGHARPRVPRPGHRERRGRQAVSVELRVLRTADELAVMPEFEAKIWGGQDDRVSVNMLVACIEEGGVAIGAFDGDRIVGSRCSASHLRAEGAALALHGGRRRVPPRRPR
jgi:hypothetical protein